MSLYSLYSILFLTFIAVFVIVFFYLFRDAKILFFFDTIVGFFASVVFSPQHSANTL